MKGLNTPGKKPLSSARGSGTTDGTSSRGVRSELELQQAKAKTLASRRGECVAKRPKAHLPLSFTGVRFKGHRNDKSRALKNILYLRDQKARSAYLRQLRKAAKVEDEGNIVQSARGGSIVDRSNDSELESLIDPLGATTRLQTPSDKQKNRTARTKYEVAASKDAIQAGKARPAAFQSSNQRNEKAQKPGLQRLAIHQALLAARSEATLNSKSESTNVVEDDKSLLVRAGESDEAKKEHETSKRKPSYVPYEKALATARARKQEQEEARQKREKEFVRKRKLLRESKKRRTSEKKKVMQRTKRGQLVMESVVQRVMKKGGL